MNSSDDEEARISQRAREIRYIASLRRDEESKDHQPKSKRLKIELSLPEEKEDSVDLGWGTTSLAEKMVAHLQLQTVGVLYWLTRPAFVSSIFH